MVHCTSHDLSILVLEIEENLIFSFFTILCGKFVLFMKTWKLENFGVSVILFEQHGHETHHFNPFSILFWPLVVKFSFRSYGFSLGSREYLDTFWHFRQVCPHRGLKNGTNITWTSQIAILFSKVAQNMSLPCPFQIWT